MQFFTVTDESNIKHKVLVIPLSQTEMNRLVGQCEKCLPSISISSLVQAGHPYVIVDFGADAWKTAIPLDEESEDGHKIGDELAVGDVLNVILTSDAKAMRVSRDKVYMNVPLESILAFSFLYTADIAENYALFKMYKQPKAE
ncbi:MAG: hypothetical protein NWE95_12690 [Candidatus Bathyarchaeota archaeon]|jgi:hypothetical protein|nr:hypothetical protein [Candidatus Bathyarchaeota archaeon]